MIMPQCVTWVRMATLCTTISQMLPLSVTRTAFAVDPDEDTITPHDPDAEIGQRIEMSELDIERVQILYGCLNLVSLHACSVL